MPNVIEITDFAAPELDVYARLTENQLLFRETPENALFVAESPLVIGRALDAGYEPVSVLTEKRHLAGKSAAVIARCGNVPVYTAEAAVLTQLTGFNLTRGMLCAMRRRKLPDFADLCAGCSRVAVLEDVVNPTNVGAIIRSAAALGMDAVLLTAPCADPLYRRAARVSMGTVFQVPWTYLPEDWHSALHELGFATAAMALSDESISLRDELLAKCQKLAVILGTEGDGLRSSTIADADFTVRIPMRPGVDSLNVAAASAVAFWELGKQE